MLTQEKNDFTPVFVFYQNGKTNKESETPKKKKKKENGSNIPKL